VDHLIDRILLSYQHFSIPLVPTQSAGMDGIALRAKEGVRIEMARTPYKFLDNDSAPYFEKTTTIAWLLLFSRTNIAQVIIHSLRFLHLKNVPYRRSVFIDCWVENSIQKSKKSPTVV